MQNKDVFCIWNRHCNHELIEAGFILHKICSINMKDGLMNSSFLRHYQQFAVFYFIYFVIIKDFGTLNVVLGCIYLYLWEILKITKKRAFMV